MSSKEMSSKSSESLLTLFSDSSKNNFARLYKPAEFTKKNKIRGANTEQLGKKRKKPKKNRPETGIDTSEAASDITTATAAADCGNEKDQRTCFVGNISTSTNKKIITKLFKECGEIDSVRFRSVPVEGTAVDEDGNQSLVKKVCSNKLKFGDQKGSLNAYVVFKDPSEAAMAVSTMNNRVLGGRHLRVDHCIASVFDPKRTVFVGSLHFYADEEDLRNHFSQVLSGGHDDIESVRIIRDPETLVGKGIAYVTFKNHDAVLKALTLDQSTFRKRKIRLSTCGKRTKRGQQRARLDLHRTRAQGSPSDVDALESVQSGSSSKKRKRGGSENDTPAARRIQMKMSLAKQQTSRSKSYNANKKKGKLGGVIKTAIKKVKGTLKK